MIRISRWLFAFLLPIAFMGGCGVLFPPIIAWKEHERVRPWPDKAYGGPFPVLVKEQESGRYYVGRLGEIRPGSSIVTSGFDWKKIKRDLSVDGQGRRLYYEIRVLNQTDTLTEISLRSPESEGEVRSWYQIRDGEVFPEAILDMRRVYPIIAFQWGFPCGLASTVVFLILVRRKPLPLAVSNREIFRDLLGNILGAISGIVAGVFVARFLVSLVRMTMGLLGIDY